MVEIQNFSAHSERLQKMASTLGVDLGQVLLADGLRHFPFHDVVYRCSQCREVEACNEWLAAHESGAVEAPEYCRNKHLLDGLREEA